MTVVELIPSKRCMGSYHQNTPVGSANGGSPVPKRTSTNLWNGMYKHKVRLAFPMYQSYKWRNSKTLSSKGYIPQFHHFNHFWCAYELCKQRFKSNCIDFINVQVSTSVLKSAGDLHDSSKSVNVFMFCSVFLDSSVEVR